MAASGEQRPAAAPRAEEDLMRNPFLRVLRASFESLYRFAAERGEGSCLLVPCAECLQGESFGQVFMETHVLRAARVPGLFMNLAGQGVEIKDSCVSTHLGFLEARTCEVLQTESMYDYSNHFSVLVIDKPLTGKFKTVGGVAAGGRPAAPGAPGVNKQPAAVVDQATEWLNSAPGIQGEFFDHIARFRKTFVQVPGCEQSTAERIRELVSDAARKLIKHHRLSLPTQQRQLELHLSRLAYAALHSFVFPYLKGILIEAEERLEAAIRGYSSVAELVDCIPNARESSLGVVDITACAEQLDLLNNKISPHEKIQCIDEAHSVLQRCVAEANQDSSRSIEITGDDVLSLFILAVQCSGWTHRLAHIAHVEMYLQGDEAARFEEGGYAVTALQGALQFFLDERRSVAATAADRSGGYGGSRSGRGGTSIISGMVGGPEAESELDRAGMHMQGLVRQARAQGGTSGGLSSGPSRR